jgi:hypothetical protein
MQETKSMSNFTRRSSKLASVTYLKLYGIILCASTNSFAVTGSDMPTSMNNNTQVSVTTKSAPIAPNTAPQQVCFSALTYTLQGGTDASTTGGVTTPANVSVITGGHAPSMCVTVNSNNAVGIDLNPVDFGGGQPRGVGTSDGHRTYSTAIGTGVYSTQGTASSSWPDVGSAIRSGRSVLPISDAWGTSPPNYCAYQSYSNPITDYWVFNGTGTYQQTVTFTITNTSSVSGYVSIGAEACCYVGGPPSYVQGAPSPIGSVSVPAGQTVTATFIWANIASDGVTLTPGISLNSGYEYSQIVGIRFTPVAAFTGY